MTSIIFEGVIPNIKIKRAKSACRHSSKERDWQAERCARRGHVSPQSQNWIAQRAWWRRSRAERLARARRPSFAVARTRERIAQRALQMRCCCARAPSAARLPIARGASAPRKAQAFCNIISDYVVELLTMHAVSAAAFFKAEL